ncbi:MAG: hypothetical protein AB1546_15745, partial [bacterium]
TIATCSIPPSHVPNRPLSSSVIGGVYGTALHASLQRNEKHSWVWRVSMETKSSDIMVTRPMEKLFRFLSKLFYERFYGCVIIKFENGKATHIEMNSTKKWQYKDLPEV